MSGIFEKIRTLTLGNIHGLLDRAIDLNSISAVKQHGRDLEEAKERMADEAAIADGRVGELKKDVTALDAQVTATNGNIELILSDGDPSNDRSAETLEAKLMAFEEQLDAKRTELEENEATALALNEAASRLKAKHAEMLGVLRKLESEDRTAKTKDRATSALKAAASTTSVDASVDDVRRRVRERTVAADARFKRALGEMADQVDLDVVAAQAKKRIEERKARLQGSGGAPSVEPQPSVTG